MTRLQCFAVVLSFSVANIATSAVSDADSIALSWRLIGNEPDGYRAELTIRNETESPLTGDWALYFNSASRLLPESVKPEFELKHLRGDFYSLRPDKQFKPIQPGESDVVSWKGAPWAINISDAPSGFYVVHGERSGNPEKPRSLTLRIEPFPDDERLRRGNDDIEPVVTAEARYAQDESLTLLPPEELIKVVPTPFDVRTRSGNVEIRKSSVILYDPGLESEADLLSAALEPLLGTRIAVQLAGRGTPHSPNAINLRIGDVRAGDDDKERGAEAYQLTVSATQGVEIIGTDTAGVFYGVQTFRALLPLDAYRHPKESLQVDAIQITDMPRFRYRGVHLDVARNFQRKETVKKLLDLMAFYKLNRFHWHLTDDEGWRLEIRQLPELTAVGGRRGHSLDEADYLVPSHGSGPDPNSTASSGNGFYTQSDIVEILRYANRRHITVIPEIDLPGHARAAIKALEARGRRMKVDGKQEETLELRNPADPSEYESVQFWRDNVVDVGRDDAYQFVAIVMDELKGMYERAGVPLTTVHLGGDEVPNGVWEKSPACARIDEDSGSKIPRRGQLELYFLKRASDVLANRMIQSACWEDCLLLETDQDANAGNARRAMGKPTPVAYVWNNVWGWGREDAAYRLANAGFDVVLCNATHLYFDLAYEKHPREPGYYWAGFVDAREPFEFVPLDVFQNAERNTMGQPVSSESLAGRTRLTEKGAQHVLGIQGQLWGENLRDAGDWEYMAFPRLIVLAERAWAPSPEWTNVKNPSARRNQLETDWNQFANRLGQRELPRLDWLNGGIHYRLPPPGAMVRDGMVYANVAFPGLKIRYTTNGSEPDQTSPLYREPVRMTHELKLKSFDTRNRGSLTSSDF